MNLVPHHLLSHDEELDILEKELKAVNIVRIYIIKRTLNQEEELIHRYGIRCMYKFFVDIINKPKINKILKGILYIGCVLTLAKKQRYYDKSHNNSQFSHIFRRTKKVVNSGNTHRPTIVEVSESRGILQ